MSIAELVYEQVKALPEQLAPRCSILSDFCANGASGATGAI